MLCRTVVTLSAVVLAFALSAAPPAAAQLTSTLVASGFSRPVAVVQDPSNVAVKVVVEQGGRVRVLVNGVVQPTDYLDLTSQISSVGEQGLLGFAFAPDYGSSGRVYLNFTNTAGHSVVARFNRSTVDPLRADPSTRFDLVWPGGQAFIVQPFTNHNGGHLQFGPDGFLYLGLGDGGSGNDPDHRAQDPTTLLGKMLRLDVSVGDTHPQGYVVPPTNPFTGNGAVLGEIWAFGLRNPWRWTIDMPALGGTGALIVGDVGQAAWEEINYEPANAGGRNYGWRNREGAHTNVTSSPPYFLPLTDPIFEYPRDVGRSITGGVVYRGHVLPASYRGRYFFGDFVTSRIWSLGLQVHPTTGEATVVSVIEHTGELGAAATNPVAFGLDESGELFVVSYGGAVYRIGTTAPPAASGCTTVQPGPGWTCANGGWLPPGATPPGSVPPPPPPPPPPTVGACPSVQPGPDWTCQNGGWLPPGAAVPPPPPPVTPLPPTPPTGDCTSVRPGADWICSNGGWLPPSGGGTSPTPPPPPPPPSSGGCTTVSPGTGWVCRNGGWLPPGHPGAL